MSPDRRTLLLTFATFALQPLVLGAWFALIPAVKDTLDLSKTALALALLGMPLGLLPGLQIAGRLLTRIGPRRLLAVGFPLQNLAVFLPLIAWGQTSLFLMLAVLGVVFALTQVSLNVYAGRLEKSLGRIVMSRCHAFWAVGLAAGSLMMTGLAGIGTISAMIAIALPSAALGVWAALSLMRFEGQDGGQGALPRRGLSDIPRRLWVIAVVTLAASMCEGAMTDWAAVYLAERLPEDAAERAGVAVSIYASFLAAGRFAGDAAKSLLGVVVLARGALMLAFAGLLLLILPMPLWAAYPGFALIGLGASVGFPLGVSAAAALDDTHEGPNIAILSSITMLGFLAGPPIIGTLADIFGLRAGLAILLPGLILGIAFAPALRPRFSESPS